MNVQLAPGFVVQQQEEVESRERCEDVGHRIFAEIHPGMKDGDEIVLPRMSEQRPGMMPGDVRLRLRVQRDGANEATKRLTRKGDDLHAEISSRCARRCWASSGCSATSTATPSPSRRRASPSRTT